MEKHQIDIIIPCLNESLHLAQTLGSLNRYMRNIGHGYHILLLDNGSTDESSDIASRLGVEVIVKRNCSISELRNEGAANLSGDIIVFVDADVEITERWVKTLYDFVLASEKDSFVITGAPCLRPSKASLIERHWFNGNNFSKAYINSGNLITTRKLFEMLGGFDTNLRTGEDWDFCYRASMIGAIIKINRGFQAYHYGFPKNLVDFFRRELWHGQGDFSSWTSFFRSKPAVIATLNGFIFILWMSSIFISNSAAILACYPLGLFLFSLSISIKRSEAMWQIPGNMILAVFYIFARLGSFIKSFTSGKAGGLKM